jgi:hypothetical protein
MSDFTSLERAVLTFICEEQGAIGNVLRNLLHTAHITKRDNTGHGFYTSFDVDRSLPPSLFPERLVTGPDAPVKVGDQELLMGFILWLKDGYPQCLEGYQYGTKSGDQIDLHRENLSAMLLLDTKL